MTPLFKYSVFLSISDIYVPCFCTISRCFFIVFWTIIIRRNMLYNALGIEQRLSICRVVLQEIKNIGYSSIFLNTLLRDVT